ncbi:hypothetical protein D3C76_1618690 [compost metagenome]
MLRCEVHDVALQLAEDEMQHVVEMHTDIGCHPKRLARVTLPAFQVPLAARRDVSKVDFVLAVTIFGRHLVLQVNDRLVMA